MIRLLSVRRSMFKLFWKTTISFVTLDQTYLKYILVPVLIWFAKTVHAYNIWALTGSFYPGYNLYDREKNKNNDIFKKLHVQGENKGHMGFSFLSSVFHLTLVEKPFEGLIVKIILKCCLINRLFLTEKIIDGRS